MIYLDNNATTFVDPEVLEVMHSLLKGGIGNPSSVHQLGQKAKGILLDASRQISENLGVKKEELLFTSGATEAINLLVRSTPRGGHIVTSSLEHIATLEACKLTGCDVTYLDPKEGCGAIDPEQVERAIQPNTSRLVFMAANNETGVLTDLEALADIALKHQIPLIVDGVGLLAKSSVRIPPGVSAICFSGHKNHAPTGIGLAVVRKGFSLNPLVVGGPQQRLMRGGTEPLPLIVGFAKALELSQRQHLEKFEKMEALRNRFEENLTDHLDSIRIHGKGERRLPNTSNISFLGCDGEVLLMQLDLAGVAVSHGAACSSAVLAPSRVLLNMGLSREVARSAIRFSLSRMTTEEEIEKASEIVIKNVHALRSLVS